MHRRCPTLFPDGDRPVAEASITLHDLEADIGPLIRNPRLVAFFHYWRSKRADRAMPGRADLDPLEFRYVLGDIVLCDVHYDPLRFNYRLHGVNLVQRDGFDMTGKWLHERPNSDYVARIERGWSLVVTERKALIGDRLHHTATDGRQRRYETVVLPLSSDGSLIDKLITAQVPLDEH